MLYLTNVMLEAVIQHAQAGYPNEVCGLIGGPEGQACEVRALRNVAATPLTRYRVDPGELWATFQEFEAKGWELQAIYHSHPAGPPYPSETDVAESYYPDVVYLIITLAERDAPEVTAWHIQEGRVQPALWQVIET